MKKRHHHASGSYANWWVNDYPPLHGGLRFFFYAALFFWAMKQLKSPLRGVGFYEATDPRLFRPHGLFELLQVPYIEPFYLQVIAVCTAVAWLCAAVGFLTRFSAVLTAVGALFLHGMFYASNALNHYWFLPVYALVALCFARTNDAWTVDYHLWGKARRETGRLSLLDTGFARKLVLVFAVGFYFAAGVSKLATSGLAWADGHVVQYFAVTRGDSYPLAPLLADNLWLCQLLTIGTLVLEVGAPAALFLPRMRHLFILGWTMMHIGIRYGMGPAYWANIVVLCLVVDWGYVARIASSCMRPGIKRIAAAITGPVSADAGPRLRTLGPRSRSVAGWIGSLALGIIAAGALLRVSWWPLTNVYMYSPYFSSTREIRAGYPRQAYDQAESAQQIARWIVATSPNKEATEYMCYRGCLRLMREGQPSLYLFQSLGVNEWKQWVLTITGPVMIADLAAKPMGRAQFDPQQPDYPAQAFLTQYVHVLKDQLPAEVWHKYDRLEMIYVIGNPADQDRDRDPIPDEFWQYCSVETDPNPEATALVLASVPLPTILSPKQPR